MTTHRHFVESLKRILQEAEFNLQPRDVQNAGELIHHGEFGVALELICDQLQEYDAKVSHELVGLIAKAAQEMRLADTLWSWMNSINGNDPGSIASSESDLVAIRCLREEQAISFEDALERHLNEDHRN